MAIPKQTPVWDQRRNSSLVIPPAPDAVPNALRALRTWEAEEPAHAQWILDGYPTLTESEHVDRFGETYEQSRKRHK